MRRARARRLAAAVVVAGFGLLLLAHPALVAREAIWPGVVAVVALASATLAAVSRAADRPLSAARTWLAPVAASLIYLGAMALSVAASPTPPARLATPLAQVALLMVGWWLGRSAPARHTLAGAAIAGGALAGLYGLLQLAGVDVLPPPIDFRDRVLSLFANPNHFGDLCAALLPLAAAAFLWPALAPGRRGAVPGGPSGSLARRLAATGFIYAGLLLAGSRGAFWAGGGGLLVLAAGLAAEARAGGIVLRRGPLLACLGLAVAISLCLARAPVMRGPAGPITVVQRLGASSAVLDGGTRDATLAHRLFLWRAAVEMIREDPLLGAGYGQFATRLSEVRPALQDHAWHAALRPEQRRDNTPYAHNELLHLWAETGLAGLGAFLFLLACSARRLVGCLNRPASRPSAWALAASLAALGLHGLVSYPLHMGVSGYIIWILLGINFSLDESPVAADTST